MVLKSGTDNEPKKRLDIGSLVWLGWLDGRTDNVKINIIKIFK